MAWLLLEQFCVERWVGLSELITGIGTGRTAREALKQVLPAFLCL
mgnify:CR=1 FL=1